MICWGKAGKRRSLTIFAQGTPFPLRKAKKGERGSQVEMLMSEGDAVVDVDDKNHQNQPAVGRCFA